MKILTSTNTRKHMSDLIDRVKYGGEVFGIGRRDSIDAILIPFPSVYSKDADEITNISAYSRSFDFLKDEPNLYSIKDTR